MEQACNVVVAGDGAIGAALLENLLQRPQVKRVLVLGRNPGRIATGKRVSHLALDAEDAQSVQAAATEMCVVSACFMPSARVLLGTILGQWYYHCL